MTSTSETSARPLRRDAARNRELLLAAARDVFARRGLEATLDDVAREAGVGVGTAYRHFANKHELASAVLDEVFATMSAHADAALADEDAWRGLVGFLESAMDLQSVNRGLREVLMSSTDPRNLQQLQDRLMEPFVALVERAQAAGEVRADVTMADFALLTVMLCAVADLTDGTAPTVWRRFLALLLPGLRPGGPSLPSDGLTAAQLTAATFTRCQRMSGGGPA